MSVLSASGNTPLIVINKLIVKDTFSGTIVVILPDRGDRYLSTTLFRSVCAKCPP